jgi:hypothetical protein
MLLLGCGGSTTTLGGSKDASIEDSASGEAESSVGKETSVGDAAPEGSIGDAAKCADATPAPDGSTACDDFGPGSCADTPCTTEGVMCSYPATDLTGVCCGGFWSCIGI